MSIFLNWTFFLNLSGYSVKLERQYKMAAIKVENWTIARRCWIMHVCEYFQRIVTLVFEYQVIRNVGRLLLSEPNTYYSHRNQRHIIMLINYIRNTKSPSSAPIILHLIVNKNQRCNSVCHRGERVCHKHTYI